jgi:predicted DNA-binding protein with PD1-like motif
MRSIQHPGQPSPQRVAAQQVELEPFELELPGHMSLMQAVAQSMQGIGAQCATFRMQGGGFEPFSYVMPALAKTSAHAVYFSDTYPVEGAVRLETASVTFGQRDGKPWLHSHAIWIEASGRRHCGHLLPDDIQVNHPIQAQGVAVRGATFTVCPDGETNFTLFVPLKSVDQLSPQSGSHIQNRSNARAQELALKQVKEWREVQPDPMLDRRSTAEKNSASTQTSRSKGYALRVAPNIDICTALETFCRERGITHAKIQGGVGSTVGAVFDDGRVVEPFVTELLIRNGDVFTNAAGQTQAQLDVSMVDYKGGVSEGRLARGQNLVLVTFELALEVLTVSALSSNS